MATPFIRNSYRSRTKAWIPEQSFTLNDFSGGLNNVSPDNVIRDNEFTDTLNMKFIGNNLLEKREGVLPVNNARYPQLTSPITWIDEYYPIIGEPKYIYATKDSFYVDGVKICSVGGNIKGCNYVGKYYFIDGKFLYVYDGTTYYKVQSEPSSYLTADFAKGGTTFYVEDIPSYVVVGNKIAIPSAAVDGYSGGNFFTATIQSIAADRKSFTVTSAVNYAIPKMYGVNKTLVLFYEPSSKTYGEEIWDKTAHVAYYKPSGMQLADANAGSSYIPTSPNVIKVHSNRLFITGDKESPSTVYMSAIDMLGSMPLYFPSNASITVTPNGQSVVDMVVFDNSLIIGRNEDLYVLYGDTEYPPDIVPSGTQFYVKRMDASTGFMCTNCGSLINNYYIYLGYDGRFYALNTPTTFVEYLMTKPLPWKCDIYSAPFSIPQNTVVNVSSVVYRNEVYFAINDSFVIVYNYDNMSYTYYVGWKATALYSDGINLFIGMSTGVFAKWQDDVGNVYNDCGLPIHCNLSTKRFDLGMSAAFKYFKRFMLTTHAYPDEQSSIQVDFEVDYYKKSNTGEDFTIESNVGRYGISKWGKAVFGTMEFLKSGWINIDVRGRMIKFMFSNNSLDEPMRIYDLNVLWGIRDIR